MSENPPHTHTPCHPMHAHPGTCLYPDRSPSEQSSSPKRAFGTFNHACAFLLCFSLFKMITSPKRNSRDGWIWQGWLIRNALNRMSSSHPF